MKVITGEGRFSYEHIWEPKAVKPGDKPKYSLSFIFSKSDTKTFKKVQEAINSAYEDGKGLLRGKGKNAPPLSSLNTPLHDGDAERPDDEAYQNSYYIQANSISRPGIVDADLQPIINPEEVYSGCYGRISVNFYAYNVGINKGIAAGLNNIQKLRDGEPLGGNRSSAEEDFGGEGSINEGFEDDGFLD